MFVRVLEYVRGNITTYNAFGPAHYEQFEEALCLLHQDTRVKRVRTFRVEVKSHTQVLNILHNLRKQTG